MDLRLAQFERKPHGHIILDGQEVAHTLQCAHCGKHWISVRGSGKVRGFCRLCSKVTCGDTACNNCTPFEARLDVTDATNFKTIKRLMDKYPSIKRI